MVDMNCTWDLDDVLNAKEFFCAKRHLHGRRTIRSDDTAGYIRLTKELGGIKVAGIESEQGVSDLQTDQSRCDGCGTGIAWVEVVLPDAEILPIDSTCI